MDPAGGHPWPGRLLLLSLHTSSLHLSPAAIAALFTVVYTIV